MHNNFTLRVSTGVGHSPLYVYKLLTLGRSKDNIHFIVMVEHISIDSLDRANVLNHHFSSVFTTEEDASFLLTVHDHDIPTMYLITISSMGVASLLKPFRATGPDDIPAYLLNKVATQIRPSPNNYRPISLFCLCCKILEQSLF